MSAEVQINGQVVRNAAGDHFVQLDIGVGPLVQRMIMEPAFAAGYLSWVVDNLPALVAEVERQNNMRGFQVVTEMPTLPPMNGTGRRGEGP